MKKPTNPSKIAQARERRLAAAVFPRRLPKIPVQMQHSSELWLDFFQNFSAQMLEDCGPGQRVDALGHARVLADAALTIFEERWPGVKL